MENTIENKARFFALYWGIDFVYKNEYGTYKDVVGGINFHKQLTANAYLPLKPLSLITDEERHILIGIAANQEDEEYMPLHSADYLRSKGYAMPFMGLSVETMIEYGWIKLKTK